MKRTLIAIGLVAVGVILGVAGTVTAAPPDYSGTWCHEGDDLNNAHGFIFNRTHPGTGLPAQAVVLHLPPTGHVWTKLVVKGGDGSITYDDPRAGISYFPPFNRGGQHPDVSNYCVTKERNGYPTTTTTEVPPSTTSPATTVPDVTTTTSVTTTVPTPSTSVPSTSSTTVPDVSTTVPTPTTSTTVPPSTSTVPPVTTTSLPTVTRKCATNPDVPPESPLCQRLPDTGAASEWLAMIGAGLILGGAMLLLARQTRPNGS